MNNTEIEMSSGNVFADLGLPNPEERQMKSLLAIQIRELIEQTGLTQTEAVQQTGITEAEMTAIFRGRLADLSLEQLFRCLTRLGRSVEVRVLAEQKSSEAAHMTLVMA